MAARGAGGAKHERTWSVLGTSERHADASYIYIPAWRCSMDGPPEWWRPAVAVSKRERGEWNGWRVHVHRSTIARMADTVSLSGRRRVIMNATSEDYLCLALPHASRGELRAPMCPDQTDTLFRKAACVLRISTDGARRRTTLVARSSISCASLGGHGPIRPMWYPHCVRLNHPGNCFRASC
ncbi:hypothetical protein DAEQUDRAFT_271228 [Daedalea quercina L-15889]|uniref:Uncharacterized protein n=1 Tax=Daedalea quercina L-15889 TaxID=1314783 RepID=A0A165QCN1_9APHY|nr:hypothetical protein DAEQUDRAFT_271228 [Daedalea quercina L-15889]